MKRTITGFFPDDEAALDTSERIRELVGRAKIQLFLPGKSERMVQTTVITHRSDWRKISVLGFVLGLVSGYAVVSLGASWGLGVLAVLTGAFGGAMWGYWLSGEEQRNVSESDRALSPKETALLAQGKPAILVTLFQSKRYDKVRAEIERRGSCVIGSDACADVAGGAAVLREGPGTTGGA